ncbi:MAG: hypothetical protein ACPL1F_06960 [bacterium]
MIKKRINKAFSLVELLIYAALLSLVILFLIQIIIYYQKSSKTIDQISVFQMKINSTITVLDYDFTNAGYTALQDGVVLSSFYYVDQNGQVVNNNVASDVRRIRLTNNGFRDSIEFYYFDIQENSLAYISSATALGGGNAAEIDVDNSINMNDPAFRAMWPDPNVGGGNPNNNGIQPYYVIAYAPDSNGNWIGVLFYITNVQYQANHMQHRPLTFYGGTLNKDIINRLPSNNIRIMKPKEIYKLRYFVDNNDNLIRQVYNFRTDNPITSTVLISNVESFNIEVALDRDNDNQVDLVNGLPDWQNSIPAGFEDRVAMLRYTIVLRSNIRNLIGLNRNPLTNAGNDGFKRYMLYRVVTLKNIVNPSL